MDAPCSSGSQKEEGDYGLSIYLWLYSPCGNWPLFQFLNLYAVGRIPWTGYQPVARLLPTHRTIQTQNHIDIHPSSGIRTHDPSVRADEDGSCLRPRSHCDRILKKFITFICNSKVYYRVHNSPLLSPILNHMNRSTSSNHVPLNIHFSIIHSHLHVVFEMIIFLQAFL
jgi:hypothetical protein